MKKVIIIWTLFCFCITAQSKNIDSLINVLNTQSPTVKEKLNIYNDICYFYLYTDLSKTAFYTKEALAFAEKEKDEIGISIFTVYLGQICEMKGNYDAALDYFNKALDIAINIKHQAQEAYIYVSMGGIYFRKIEYDKTIDYYMKALSIYEKINNKKQQVLILANIGGLYRGMENLEHAISYLERAEKIAEEIDYEEGKRKVYYDLGDVCRIKKQFDKALEYELKALEMSRSKQDKYNESVVLQALTSVYLEGFLDLEKAEEYAKESLQIAEEFAYPPLLLGASRMLSDVYYHQKRYKESETLAIKALAIDSTNLDENIDVLSTIILDNIYLGNKEKAASFFDKYITMSKQYTTKNFNDALSEKEVKYETEKKEIRINALEEEKKLYTWLGVLAAVFLLTLLLLYINYRRLSKQKIKQLEQEKQLVATQSVLDGETSERKRLAKDLHDGLGGMLSAVKVNLDNLEHLQNARELLDRSIDELRRVAHHLMPASLLRLGLKASLEDFCLSIPNTHFHYYGEDKRLDEKTEILIYRCVYELVNNALKHSDAENFNVQLVQDADRISLTVQDNGCGFDPQTVKEGMGLGNIRTRIAAFNGKIDIYSSQGNGTEVYVEFPLLSV